MGDGSSLGRRRGGVRPSFVSVLWCEDENQAEGLGGPGVKPRDEVVLDVGNPALAWCTRRAVGARRC